MSSKILKDSCNPNDAKLGFLKLHRFLTERQRELEREVQDIQAIIEENKQVLELLDFLPTKSHHEIMIPMGSQAFARGSLISTNEGLQQLGVDIFAKRLLKNCKGTLNRRIVFAEQVIKELNESLYKINIRMENSETDNSEILASKQKKAEESDALRKDSKGFIEIIERDDAYIPENKTDVFLSNSKAFRKFDSEQEKPGLPKIKISKFREDRLNQS